MMYAIFIPTHNPQWNVVQSDVIRREHLEIKDCRVYELTELTPRQIADLASMNYYRSVETAEKEAQELVAKAKTIYDSNKRMTEISATNRERDIAEHNKVYEEDK